MENQAPENKEAKKPTKMETLQRDYAMTVQRIGDLEVLIDILDNQKASLMGQAKQVKIEFDKEMARLKKQAKPELVKEKTDENDKTV